MPMRSSPPNAGPAAAASQKQQQEEWQTQCSQKKRTQAGQGWGGHKQRTQCRAPTQQQQQQQQKSGQQQVGQERGQGDSQPQGQGGAQTYSPPQTQDQRPQAQPPRAQGHGLPLSPLPGVPIKCGTLGRPGQAAVNYLDVNLDKMPAVAYHYDVRISPKRPKKFYRHAFELFRVEHLGGAIAAYDGRFSCYTADKIVCKSQDAKVRVIDRLGRVLNYTLQLKETEELEVDMSSLQSYIKDKIYAHKTMRAMQVLEVVLASPCHSTAIRAGRSFFKRSEPGKEHNIGEGYEALIGLYQSVVLGDRPFVNVDICHKSFALPTSVMEYIERYHGEEIDKKTNLELKRQDIDAFLRGIKVIYKPPVSFEKPTSVFKVVGLSEFPASKQTFDLEGKRTTVEAYFASCSYTLQFPNLLCLRVGSALKEIYLPMELCAIEDAQLLNRKDPVAQVAAMIKYAATSTNQRRAKIMHMLSFFKHNLDPTIARFGIRLESDFITVDTRLLEAPMVEYKGNCLLSVKNGAWCMERAKFYATKPNDHKWAIIYGGQMMYNQVEDFKEHVLQQSAWLSVCLERKADIRSYKGERDLDNLFLEFKRNQCDLVFVIIPNFGTTYDMVKQKAELQHGILTQCIKQFTVQRKLSPQCVLNLLLKVNSKLNGINHKLQDNPRTQLENVMFLGADVTHPSPDQREIPSVVGVAASHDPYGASYNMQYRLQRSDLEEIEDMESITSEHLRVFHQHRKRYPDHIVYYRDGVSDGQFPKIKNEELKGITAACCKMHINPKICCIVAVKRHHTRFFPSGTPSTYDKFNNVEPGTVVDTIIVHPNEMQFFLVSHQAIQGTARPTRYNVIENTGNLDIDLIQQLTYNLCHLFPRCNRAVSYPAPAYLAHLVAARGRVYLTGIKKFLSPRELYEKRLIVPQLMEKNPMYFV
ncbi:protein argonaute-2 [Drosophila obscura]|uniref:protein argonaute-2 n=1 Tax=Drosophila obscura TaxID=7282 RepID=UPI001BB2B167|nr:protein argonaute-2 [Drosophila obscura]